MADFSNRAVFLSYASQDAERVRRLAEALQVEGIEVWFDRSELRGGDAWDQKIKKQIRECALFLPVISANTNARAEGYFRLEWKLAVDRSHSMADDAAFLVPAVIDEMPDATARVPDKFREVQWTRLFTDEAIVALAARVRALLTGEPEAPVAEPRSMLPRSASAGSKSSRTVAPASEMEPGWRPVPGQLLPGTKWTLQGKIGEGGFGQVWLGRHQTMKEQRVFKFCFEPERVRSLKREMTLFRLLKEKVGTHPNIVRLLDVHFDEPPFYVEMDYVEGQSLKIWCEQQGGVERVPVATRLAIVAQAADALHAAHSAGVVHRDVKPGNILIEQATEAAPVAKLCDFGIGQVLSDEALAGVTKSGFTHSIIAEASAANSGTQIYMAPELLVGRAATPQSDIYSLGVVLFQLAVGDLHRPLTTDWPLSIEDAVLREDLARCFAGNPAERFGGADELARSLRAIDSRRAARARELSARLAQERSRRRWRGLLAAAAVVAVVGLGAALTFFVQRSAKVRKVRDEMLPEIRRLATSNEMSKAYALAVAAERLTPDDPGLKAMWEQVAVRTDFTTEPAGAEVWFKEYSKPDAEWQRLGLTPLSGVRLPRVYGRFKITKAGYVELARALQAGLAVNEGLEPAGSIPAEMVRVTSKAAGPLSTGLQQNALDPFLIDRLEVTNRQFKEFVDRGGYGNPAYWKQTFVKEGRTLEREQAMALFRDQSGKPGPAGWRNGAPAQGEDDLPVTGVSWFEAAAYAEFAGKRLPSIYHWRIAGISSGSNSLVPLSNFAGKGLAPVGRYQGMSMMGTLDMAGNAKEWCWNETRQGSRYILGGGWHEPDYAFGNLDAVSPFSREPSYGFRCMKLLGPVKDTDTFDAPFSRTLRDYSSEQPVNDETFAVFRRFFAYDKTPLDAKLEAKDDSKPKWRREKVSFKTAYGERMAAVLFLPRDVRPPFQTIVFFPGSSAQNVTDSEKMDTTRIDILVASGRAVIYPVYQTTFERRRQGPSPEIDSAAYRDEVIMQFKDMARAIDYLESRTDIQTDKLAYVGLSWGAILGSIYPALEPRIKTSVLLMPGFWEAKTLPEIDPINFAPRNKAPTLMVAGRYDYRLPLEECQKPMFKWLGAPPEHKKHLLYDTGHSLSSEQVIAAAYPWLDKYLGPAK